MKGTRDMPLYNKAPGTGIPRPGSRRPSNNVPPIIELDEEDFRYLDEEPVRPRGGGSVSPLRGGGPGPARGLARPRSFSLPGKGFASWLTRPTGYGRHSSPFAFKLIIGLTGLLTWVWGGVLSYVYLNNLFPSVTANTTHDVLITLASFIISFFFLGAEILFWRGGLPPYVILALLVVFYFDIRINYVGMSLIFKHKPDWGLDDASLLLELISAATAISPEWFIKTAIF